jgi:translation initiation factor 1
MTDKGRLVYSTDDPNAAKRAKTDKRQKPHAAPKGPPPGVKGDTVYVERSKSGRKGKTVTLIINMPGDAASKKKLLKQLKAQCGAGGTLKDGVLEVQGDHRDKLIETLKGMGHTVKPRGG